METKSQYQLEYVEKQVAPITMELLKHPTKDSTSVELFFLIDILIFYSVASTLLIQPVLSHLKQLLDLILNLGYHHRLILILKFLQLQV